MTDPRPTQGFLSDELRLRIVSAVVLGIFVLLVTWIGGQTFKLFCALVALLIFREFSVITASSMPKHARLLGLAFLFLTLVAGYIAGLTNAVLIFGAGVLALAAWELITNKTAWASIALAYSALPYFAMSQLRGDEAAGLLVLLVLFACVWGADVFAYFAGKSIGGPKLAPRISPKKTWAGFVGGLAGGVIIALILVFVSGYSAGIAFVLLVLICAVVSQIGDLAESIVKRRFDVKDSGNIIPGHGGLLDRIDGLIPASVLLWLILELYRVQPDARTELGSVFVNSFLLP